MQNRIEPDYMQANKDKELLTTVVEQHMMVIGILAHVEDQRCLDYEQYKAIKTELSQINASLHTLAEAVWFQSSSSPRAGCYYSGSHANVFTQRNDLLWNR